MSAVTHQAPSTQSFTVVAGPSSTSIAALSKINTWDLADGMPKAEFKDLIVIRSALIELAEHDAELAQSLMNVAGVES